jgi:hypothetical protein
MRAAAWLHQILSSLSTRFLRVVPPNLCNLGNKLSGYVITKKIDVLDSGCWLLAKCNQMGR